MNVRPYRLLGDRDLAAARQRILAKIQAWESGWGAQLPVPVVALSAAHATGQPEGGQWYAYHQDEQPLAWIKVPEALVGFCEQGLFAAQRDAVVVDAQRESELARQLAVSASEALLMALSQLDTQGEAKPQVSAATPPASLFQPGSGALMVEWALKPGQTLCMVYADIVPVRPTRKSAQPLASLRKAMRAQAVALHIDLGEVTLTLGQLESLHIGDVIRLDRHLGESLRVCDTQGVPVFAAQPGKKQGQRAIAVQKLK